MSGGFNSIRPADDRVMENTELVEDPDHALTRRRHGSREFRRLALPFLDNRPHPYAAAAVERFGHEFERPCLIQRRLRSAPSSQPIEELSRVLTLVARHSVGQRPRSHSSEAQGTSGSASRHLPESVDPPQPWQEEWVPPGTIPVGPPSPSY